MKLVENRPPIYSSPPIYSIVPLYECISSSAWGKIGYNTVNGVLLSFSRTKDGFAIFSSYFPDLGDV